MIYLAITNISIINNPNIGEKKKICSNYIIIVKTILKNAFGEESERNNKTGYIKAETLATIRNISSN